MIVRTDLATCTRITLLAVTQHVVIACVQRATLGMRIATGKGIGTAAGTATDLITQQRITIVTIQTGIAAKACGRVLTVKTLSSEGITVCRMSITLADTARGEVPVARLALIALPAIGIRMAGTLTRQQITIVVLATDTITIAGLATLRSKAIGTRRTLIALATHHIGFALTEAAIGIAFLTQRSRRIAVTHAGTIVDILAGILLQITANR